MARRSLSGAKPGSRGSSDPLARGHVIDRLYPAALQVGNHPLQALPPPTHVEKGLGLAKDPVVFDRPAPLLAHVVIVPADTDISGGARRLISANLNAR